MPRWLQRPTMSQPNRTSPTRGLALAFAAAVGMLLVALSIIAGLMVAATPAGAQGSCSVGTAPAAPFVIPPDSAAPVPASGASEVVVVGTAGTTFSLLALSSGHDAVSATGTITDDGLVRVPLTLANGEWLLGATVTDSCGQQSTAFNTRTQVDLTAPEVGLRNAAVDRSTLSVEVATDRTAEVTVEVLDASGATAHRRQVTVGRQGSTEVNFTVADGSYRLQAAARDTAGRESTTRLTDDPLLVDVTPPAAVLTVPVLSEEPETVSIRIEAEEGATVTVAGRGLDVAAEFISTGVAREYTFATAPGDYTIDVTATDAMGNSFERSLRTRVQPEPSPMFSRRVVGVVIGALLLATMLLWRWLRSREAEVGETGEAQVLRPQNA